MESTSSTGVSSAGDESIVSSELPSQVEFPTADNSSITASVGAVTAIVSSLKKTSSQAARVSSTPSKAVASVSSKQSAENKDPAYTPSNASAMKAVWISYFEVEPMVKNKSESAVRQAIGKAYDNLVDLGINTVIVQVRQYGDASYQSDYYPWSKYVSGTMGKAPAFDPLPVLIDEAHKRKLSFHAWINPLRGMSQSDMGKVSDSLQIKKWYNDRANSDRCVYLSDKGRWYLNPAYPEVRQLIADGAAEIVKKYDVDAIHIDDYFYPTTAKSFDEKSYQKYGKNADRSTWRLNNCSQMVSMIYSAVKKANAKVLFGVSPAGNINNNYSSQYADVKLWCSKNGYLDYIAPQIYFGFKNSAQPYENTLKQWNSLITAKNITLVPGLAVYKIGGEDSYAGSGKTEWINDSNIISRQIAMAKTQSKYGGVALFSYRSMFSLTTGKQNSGAKLQQDMASMKKQLQ